MKVFSAFFAVCLLAISQTSLAERQPMDKIVAVVEQDVILESEFAVRVQQVVANARSNNMALPDLKVLQQQVLDHLISEELQLQMARRVNMNINDQQINMAIENIKAGNKINQQQLEAELNKDGISIAAFREKLRRDITLQQIQQAMVQQRIQISPLEIDNFLKSAEAKFWISPEYHLGHILLGLPQAASDEEVAEAKQKAQELIASVRKGKPFADVAIAHSNGPAALQGGDLGWRKTSGLPSLFAEVVPSLKTGDVSEPFRSPAGFHILTLYGKRGDEQQTQDQALVRHILVKTSAIVSDDEAKAKLQKLRKDILAGADFAALAKENSEDIGSMLSGGDLGWSNPDYFVPEFASAVRTLPIGEISQPIQTQFGWHIVQVQERRKEDITDEVLKDRAARIIMNRRFEDELQVWLRELRDNAYVDVRI